MFPMTCPRSLLRRMATGAPRARGVSRPVRKLLLFALFTATLLLAWLLNAKTAS